MGNGMYERLTEQEMEMLTVFRAASEADKEFLISYGLTRASRVQSPGTHEVTGSDAPKPS